MIILDHIDAIGRSKQRAVLYLEFHPLDQAARKVYRFEDDVARSGLLDWLDENGLAWMPCGPIADPARMDPYRGQIYVDVVFDADTPDYRLLRDALEHPDGTMKHAWVRFMVLPLDYAMRNAAHDAPGFWENWASNF